VSPGARIGPRPPWGAALLVLGCALLTACHGAGAPVAPAPASPRPAVDMGRLSVLMINGGSRPPLNFQSHLLHVRELYALLQQAGVRPDQVSILSADGADPANDLAVREVEPGGDFWLLHGTRLERALGTQVTYANSEVPGATLQAATKENLTAWFEAARRRLRAGDTLLLYVTDHGTKNADDLTNNRITLWGEHESLAVSELRELLDRLDPGVRVVMLMSQCFSGAFGSLIDVHAVHGVPRGNVCGYFSSTADRPAYGCYPENRGRENVGYSFLFLQALRIRPRFPDAQAAVLVNDQTPDVPITTSSEYAARLLGAAAEKAGEQPVPFTDALLREAWHDKGAWEPDIRQLDRIGQAFGVFSPRSLAELEDQATRLPDISEQFKNYSGAWKGALGDLTQANLNRFLAVYPDWGKRANDAELAKLDPDAARALGRALLADLAPYTRADRRTNARLAVLREKSEAAAEPTYRMDVRLGVVLRMRAILTDIAGRVYLATRGSPEERAAYAAVRGCEDFTLGSGAPLPGPVTLVERDPFPRFEDDVRVAEQILPAWMGIRFKAATPAQRQPLDLKDGAAAVVTVFPDSPAEAAGFQLGDLVAGPPGAHFTEPNQIREWTMLSRIDRPAPLDIAREGKWLRLTLVPKPFPQKWPSLPGPPEVGSLAPPLSVAQYRGTLPATLAGSAPHLLFFWATWCAPCKASLPEVLALEVDTHTPVIAITDEPSEQLDAFFRDFGKPFPAVVAIDEFRKAFQAYGVSGTPTFVLVDASGTVRAYGTGYNADKGLPVDGWTWTRRAAAP
jgi:thiol-disulfide isomerase/thioredoxin